MAHLLDTAAVAELLWDGFLARSTQSTLDEIAGGPGRGRRLFAPFSSPDVGGVEDCTGEVEQAGVVQAVQDLFVQPAPDTSS